MKQYKTLMDQYLNKNDAQSLIKLVDFSKKNSDIACRHIMKSLGVDKPGAKVILEAWDGPVCMKSEDVISHLLQGDGCGCISKKVAQDVWMKIKSNSTRDDIYDYLKTKKISKKLIYYICNNQKAIKEYNAKSYDLNNRLYKIACLTKNETILVKLLNTCVANKANLALGDLYANANNKKGAKTFYKAALNQGNMQATSRLIQLNKKS